MLPLPLLSLRLPPMLPSPPSARSARRIVRSKSSRYGRCQFGKASRPCTQYSGNSPGSSGGSPPWIVHGTYMSNAYTHNVSMGRDVRATLPKESVPQLGAGVLRSNLANEEFIQWLVYHLGMPDTPAHLDYARSIGQLCIKMRYFARVSKSRHQNLLLSPFRSLGRHRRRRAT